MKLLRNALNWLLYSNVFIAICAMAFTLQGYLLLHQAIRWDLVAVMSGVATLFVYLLIRVAATARIREYHAEERWDFFLRYHRVWRVIVVIAFFACLILYFLLPFRIQMVLLLPGVISVFYGLPFGKKEKPFRLRDFGVTKIFMISFVWAFIGSMLPAVNAELRAFDKEVLILFAANYFFIFGITLPFDLKDLIVDAKSEVKTIPALLGEQNTYSLSYLCLFISDGLHAWLQHLSASDAYDFTSPVSYSILVAGAIIFLTSKKKESIYYFGLLDGSILLQFLLCYFFQS